MTSSKHTPYLITLTFAILAFGLALLAFAYSGSFTRYWADDYCYNAVLRSDGFWRAQVSFYQHTSDRYSVIPLVGISELFGPQAIRLWPAVGLLLGAVALVWSLGKAARFFGGQLGLAERLLITFSALFFTFWQAPNLFQSLYWRTGMLTYWMPLALNLLLVGLILDWTWRRELKRWVLPAIFLLAFFAGGFSETTTALQAGGLGLALAGALTVERGWLPLGGERRKGAQGAAARVAMRRLLLLLGVGLLSTLLAMVALFLSPSNALRLVHMPEPAPLPVLVGLSLRYAFDFAVDTVSSQPLPTLVSMLLPLALSLAYQAACLGAPNPRRSATGLALSLAVAYLLIVCVCAPSVYVEVAYPEPRALIAARLVMVLGLAAAGWLAGQLLYYLLRRVNFLPAVVLTGALALLVLASLYPLRAAWTIWRQDVPQYRQRAVEWDARHREILTRVEQGEQAIQVRALDSIAGLMELTDNPRRFPNNCAAGAYGLSEITGTVD